jgi:hypothetical protein
MEKVIHFIIFLLFLIGTYGITAYAFAVSLGGLTSLLFYASTAIAWGAILLILYLVFERQDWKWWT